MIDAERLVHDYLDDELDTRVVGRTPPDTSGTWITLVQLDARAVDDHRSDHVIDYLLQLSIYAGSQQAVWSLALAARAALKNMIGVHDLGVVTGVIFTGMPRIPDTDFKPARERVILTARVIAHPA